MEYNISLSLENIWYLHFWRLAKSLFSYMWHFKKANREMSKMHFSNPLLLGWSTWLRTGLDGKFCLNMLTYLLNFKLCEYIIDSKSQIKILKEWKHCLHFICYLFSYSFLHFLYYQLQINKQRGIWMLTGTVKAHFCLYVGLEN